jgi:hypothetical protein
MSSGDMFSITLIIKHMYSKVSSFLVKALNMRFYRVLICVQGMMVNEFADRVYSCGAGCACMFQTVLDQYGYKTGETVKWVGILLAIVFGLRLFGWIALWVRK